MSIRDIATAVGVTPPAIYLHFPDKAALLFAVSEEHFAALDGALEEAAAGATDPLDELERRGRAYVRFGLEHPEPYRILFMTKSAARPAGWTSERLMASAAFNHLVDAVRRCMDAGAVRPADPVVVAVGLWALVHGITSLLVSRPDFPWPDLDTLLDHLLVTHVRGLAP